MSIAYKNKYLYFLINCVLEVVFEGGIVDHKGHNLGFSQGHRNVNPFLPKKLPVFT